MPLEFYLRYNSDNYVIRNAFPSLSSPSFKRHISRLVSSYTIRGAVVRIPMHSAQFALTNLTTWHVGGIEEPNNGQAELSWTNVAMAMTFIVFNVGVSTVCRLGVGVSLMIAALRCVGQLAVVATLLQKVFETSNPWLVALISCECAFTMIYI